MKEFVIPLVTAAIATLGFSILFYVHPRRLLLATVGGVLTCAVYLGLGAAFSGELIPNLVAAALGAAYSEVCARLTRVPVPVYMIPCVIPLVPGSGLYATMFALVSGEYATAATAGLTTLQAALGIAGGIIAASVVALFIRPRRAKASRPATPSACASEGALPSSSEDGTRNGL